MKPIAIVDIDTTIANNDHRAVLLDKHCRDCGEPMGSEHRSVCSKCGCEKYVTPQHAWDRFLDPDLILKDTPVKHALEVLDGMRSKGWRIVFLTGRNERLRACTEQWLTEHMKWEYPFMENGIPIYKEPVLMRPSVGADLPASQMKEKMFVDFVNTFGLQDHPFLFFEDDRYVQGIWQKYGQVFICPQAWEFMNPVPLDRVDEPSWNR